MPEQAPEQTAVSAMMQVEFEGPAATPRPGAALRSGEIVRAPQGLIGFEHCRSFVWTALRASRFAGLFLLRAADDLDLALLLLPLPGGTPLLSPADLAEAVATFEETDCYAILAPALDPAPGGALRATANLMAPLAVDRRHRLCRQVVLSNARLPLRHPLTYPPSHPLPIA